MTSIKDWVLSQMVSKSIGARPLSALERFLSEESLNEGPRHQGSHNNMIQCPVSADVSHLSGDNQISQYSVSSQVDDSSGTNTRCEVISSDPPAKIEALQIKLFRILSRLGLSQSNLWVARVLYRIHSATLIRASESDLKKVNFNSVKAREIAAEQEERGQPELDFCLKILVLGRTGSGKSSTINSILGESKVTTDAFQPATTRIQEIVGIVNGIRLSFIDTPGLLHSSTNTVGRNRKILHSVKRFIKKSRPDVVLYFERLDLINMGYCDYPLLKLITDILGPAIWFSTNIVMTHASAALPEGQNGYPVSYNSYVSYCTNVVQNHIHMAISDTKLEIPVILVENHQHCKMDRNGRKILPDGEPWTSQFLLLCVCNKILADVNSLLEFEDKMLLGPVRGIRLPSLPRLLSSFLKHQVQLHPGGVDSEMDENIFPGEEEEDEYDQLPPIRILTRLQFQKLTSSQKKDYLYELDYRETLYLKKLRKEEYLQRKSKENDRVKSDENPDDQEEPPVGVLLPDMTIPPSFDSNAPVHRFRCLDTSDQWLARPVLDPHGWDHDVGFDGINIEMASEVRKNFFMHAAGQLSKDKQDFNIQSASTVGYVDPKTPSCSIGLDMQSAGEELVCSVHGNTKFNNFVRNVTECGVQLTYFGKNHVFGTKIEDSILINRRVKLKLNAGHMTGSGQTAYGGSFEATFRGKDYPVRDEKISLSMTILSFNKEPVLSGNILTDLRLSPSTSLSLSTSLNNQKMGQVRLKINSSEHMELALVAAISLFRFLLRKESRNDSSSKRTLETV